jgi:hypothetical protein
VGCDQLELLASYREGRLHRYYRSEALDGEQVQAGLWGGKLIVDSRLQKFMTPPTDCAQESPGLQALLRRAWATAQSVADTKRDLTATETRLRTAEAQTAEFARQLSIIRNSRIMRYSSPARRAYYRIRQALTRRGRLRS